jgi:hypothetical protein
MKKFFVLFAFSAIVFSACKNDLNLISKWKEQMVIYGLLNQSDTVQYIRINKAFLGQGNAYTMAAVHDSLNYPYLLNVTLEKWQNGGFVSSYRVDTTSMIPQDAGAFANQPQILYRVHTGPGNPLTDDSQYHLTVTNPVTGYSASGLTSLVVSSANNALGVGVEIGFAPPTSYKFYNTLSPARFKWTTGVNGRIYNLILRFHYTEYAISGNTSKYVDLNFGNNISQGLGGGEQMEADITWDGFRHFLASAIPADPAVGKRVMGNVEFMLYVGGDEFYTYQQVNQPVSSITGDKPTYTNIVNGIGLFSARYTFDQANYNKPVENVTLDNIATDPLTCPLHFADHNGNVSPGC